MELQYNLKADLLQNTELSEEEVNYLLLCLKENYHIDNFVIKYKSCMFKELNYLHVIVLVISFHSLLTLSTYHCQE